MLVISRHIDFIVSKIEVDSEVLDLLTDSYTAEDRDRCHAISLEFHQLAFETIEHTTPLGQNTLLELHAVVIRRPAIQNFTFPKASPASTIGHD